MTSQTELLTLKFYFSKFFELVTRGENNFHIVLELVTRVISELLTRKHKIYKILELLTRIKYANKNF